MLIIEKKEHNKFCQQMSLCMQRARSKWHHA